jgi:hypothetical protein
MVDESRADEAGGTRDKDTHSAILPSVRRLGAASAAEL